MRKFLRHATLLFVALNANAQTPPAASTETLFDGIWHQTKVECEKGGAPVGTGASSYLTLTGVSRIFFSEASGCRLVETSTYEVNLNKKLGDNLWPVTISNRVGTIRGDASRCPKNYKSTPSRDAKVYADPSRREIKFFITDYPEIPGLPNPCAGKGTLIQSYERVI